MLYYHAVLKLPVPPALEPNNYACAAWDVINNADSVKVGVLDTGIDNYHIDLANRVNANLSRDFSMALDGMVPNYGLGDANGHGTHVSGIISAKGIGVTGICWDVELVSLKISDKSTSYYTTFFGVIRYAIDFAAYNYIDILNLSGGNEDSSDPNLGIMKAAIQNYPGVFVCAAGNSGVNNDQNPHYPAFLTSQVDNIISVGATNIAGTSRADMSDPGWYTGSNYGATTVDIFAPGTWILSTFPEDKCLYGYPSCISNPTVSHLDNGYHYMSGTSMAAPHISGICALIKAHFPGITAHDIKQIILNNAEKLPAFNGMCVSGGRLNAGKIFDMFGGGDGSISTPYQIQDNRHLRNLTYTYYSNQQEYYEITANIDVSAGGLWIPMNYFYGTLLGNNNTVSGLYINNNYAGYENIYEYGLFKGNNGIIKDLTIKANIIIQPSFNSSLEYIGAFAGYNSGEIDNCTSTNNMSSAIMIQCGNEDAYIGGIAGINAWDNSAQIINCINNGVIHHSGTMGGISGSNWGTIDNSINNGILQYLALGDHSIGGINGLLYGGTITNNVNNAQIYYAGPNTNELYQPCMAQIIGAAGMRYGPIISGNSWFGNVYPGYLHPVGSFNQAEYVNNGEVGKYY